MALYWRARLVAFILEWLVARVAGLGRRDQHGCGLASTCIQIDGRGARRGRAPPGAGRASGSRTPRPILRPCGKAREESLFNEIRWFIFPRVWRVYISIAAPRSLIDNSTSHCGESVNYCRSNFMIQIMTSFPIRIAMCGTFRRALKEHFCTCHNRIKFNNRNVMKCHSTSEAFSV